jgi:isoleucyl-tRNA synthetase
LAKWQRIRSLREAVNKEAETLREAGQIGASLQAEVTLTASGQDYADLASLGADLKFVLISSVATLVQGAADAPLAISVQPTAKTKCVRCWHYTDDVQADGEHAGICLRCESNLFGAGETRKMA